MIGAGAMGGDIAAWAALRGLTVTLQDLAPDRISPAIKRAAELTNTRVGTAASAVQGVISIEPQL